MPNSTLGPHLAPYPLSCFSRAVPPHLLALLHGVSRFIRIFAPGDVTLSCLDEKSLERKIKEERNRAVTKVREREGRRARESQEEREEGSTRDP